ncbi:putative transketolase [Klebsiella pneumoniae]|uniref:Putative transketolase n=1 Tax=Klebsiella pneumoniae TaxID=573 RepID=A0A378BH90_KLEPN|nr:putative transketolase [Klebsiella pneumoniae]
MKICAALPGLTTGYGPSHQATEDLAIMRVSPDGYRRSLRCAGDRAGGTAIADHQGPVYMRLLRGKVPLVLDKYDYQFELGKAKLLEDGNDVLIISSGLMTMRALEAAEKLRADNIGVAVLHVPTIKPLDEKAIIEQASKPGRLVVTAENHTAVGGLGEAVAALLMRKGVRCELDSVGLPDAFLLAGALPTLHDRYGISTAKIVEKLSIVCVNPIAMTHWPLSALSDLLMPASQARHSFADFMRPVTKSARTAPLHGIVVFAISYRNNLPENYALHRAGAVRSCYVF